MTQFHKKTILVLCILTILLTTFGASAEDLSPYAMGGNSMHVGIHLENGHVYGLVNTALHIGYTNKINIYIQENDGSGWNTISYTYGVDYVTISAPARLGCDYRICGLVHVYKPDGSYLETMSHYSPVRAYY